MGSPSLTGGGMRLTLIIVLIGFIGLSLGSLAETGEGGTQLEAQDGKFRDVRAAEAGRKNGNGRKRERKAEKKNGRNRSKNGNRSKSNKKQRNLKNGRKRKGQLRSERRKIKKERKQRRRNKKKKKKKKGGEKKKKKKKKKKVLALIPLL